MTPSSTGINTPPVTCGLYLHTCTVPSLHACAFTPALHICTKQFTSQKERSAGVKPGLLRDLVLHLTTPPLLIWVADASCFLHADTDSEALWGAGPQLAGGTSCSRLSCPAGCRQFHRYHSTALVSHEFSMASSRQLFE